MAASMGLITRNRFSLISHFYSSFKQFHKVLFSSSSSTSTVITKLVTCSSNTGSKSGIQDWLLAKYIHKTSAGLATAVSAEHCHSRCRHRFAATGSGEQGRPFKFIGLCVSISWLFKKKKEEEETIELFVAKATVAERNGHMDKAEDYFHHALQLAHQQQELDKVTFIYDLMANFYLRIHKHLKAEELFKETIKQLLQAGFQEHDPAVIEISLKLASIYDMQFRYTEAEAGFRFCISKAEEGLKAYKERGSSKEQSQSNQGQEGHDERAQDDADRAEEMNLYAMLGMSMELRHFRDVIPGAGYTEAEAGFRFCVSKAEEGLKAYEARSSRKEQSKGDQEQDGPDEREQDDADREEEMNLYAMLGMSLDTLGKFLLNRGNLVEAESTYLRAIKICENELAVNGKPHFQLATLLNDLGTVYERKNDYNKAMEMVSRAEVLAKDDPEDLAVMLCNKATIHLRKGDREEATTLFRKALKLADKSHNEETIMFVRKAMAQLAAPRKGPNRTNS